MLALRACGSGTVARGGACGLLRRIRGPSAVQQVGWGKALHLLSHEIVEQEEHVAGGGEVSVLLHGLMGNRKNWRQAAATLRTKLQCPTVTADLRGHGHSVGGRPEGVMRWQGPHTLEACAEDVLRLLRHVGKTPHVLSGHSFGGKVVLECLRVLQAQQEQEHPLMMPRHVWVLDAPVTHVDEETMARSEAMRVFEAVKELPPEFPSRTWLVDFMLQRDIPLQVARWLTTNVRRADDDSSASSFLSVDTDIIDEMLPSYRDADYIDFLADFKGPTQVHIVRAGRSQFWDPIWPNMLHLAYTNLHVQLHTIEDAGHWLHVDALETLTDLMCTHSTGRAGDVASVEYEDDVRDKKRVAGVLPW